jgi:hypothetical protein
MQRVEQVYKAGDFTVVVIGKGKNPTVYFMKENLYYSDDGSGHGDDGNETPIKIGSPAYLVLQMDYYLKMSKRVFSTITSIANMRWGFRK